VSANQLGLFAPAPPLQATPEPAAPLDGYRARCPLWWPCLGAGTGVVSRPHAGGWVTATRPTLSGWEPHRGDWIRVWRPAAETVGAAPETPESFRRDYPTALPQLLAAVVQHIPRAPWWGWKIDVPGRLISTLGGDPGRAAEAMRRADAQLVRALRWDAPRVILISCSGPKLDRAAPAGDLYTSALFKKARSYAEAEGVPWGILSAEHGILWPDEEIEPYDLRLSALSPGQRIAWAARTLHLVPEIPPGRVLEIHAGEAYLSPIREGLEGRGWQVEEPLAGLEIGRRLQWYARRADQRALGL